MTHVLVARLDSEGDVLLAGPAIRAVAAGADRVTLLCGPRGRQAGALLPGVDELLVFRAPWIDPDPVPVERAAMLELVDRIAALGVDQAIALTSFHQSALPLALLLRMAGIETIAAISEDYPGSLLDVRHHAVEGRHEVVAALSTVGALGYALPPGDPGDLRLDTHGAHLPPGVEPPYVVVHPGASVPARAWDPRHSAHLVTALANAGRQVVVTGSAGERELTARVAGPARDGVVDLGGATELPELAEVLAAADAVVVGNTGPAHLAAAVGTPVVSLFAPTVAPARWRPWLVAHELLYVDVPCAGCRARQCPVAGHPCLGGVTVGDVLAALDRIAEPRLREVAECV
jgi:ADP-heptose:LPS heptosyltransferase